MLKQKTDPPTKDLTDIDLEDVDLEEGDQTPSPSERLKDVDKKTFMFAGYIFWAMILVAGASTAGVLLSKKKPEPIPTTPPTPFPTPLPTFRPSRRPTPPPTFGCEPWPKGTVCVVNISCEKGCCNNYEWDGIFTKCL